MGKIKLNNINDFDIDGNNACHFRVGNDWYNVVHEEDDCMYYLYDSNGKMLDNGEPFWWLEYPLDELNRETALRMWIAYGYIDYPELGIDKLMEEVYETALDCRDKKGELFKFTKALFELMKEELDLLWENRDKNCVLEKFSNKELVYRTADGVVRKTVKSVDAKNIHRICFETANWREEYERKNILVCSKIGDIDFCDFAMMPGIVEKLESDPNGFAGFIEYLSKKDRNYNNYIKLVDVYKSKYDSLEETWDLESNIFKRLVLDIKD